LTLALFEMTLGQSQHPHPSPDIKLAEAAYFKALQKSLARQEYKPQV
jgi:hypothetical protein